MEGGKGKAGGRPGQWPRRRLLRAAGTGLALGGGLGLAPLGAKAAAPAPRGWDMRADVVVAGSGAAGLAAAIEARRGGAAVLVLEKLRRAGGSSALSGGVCYLGGGTDLQKSLGYTDTKEAMFRYILESGTAFPQEEKLRLYCEESAQHFRWLVECGVPYKKAFSKQKGLPAGDESLYYSGNELGAPYRDTIPPVPRGHCPGVPGQTGGRRLMEALLDTALGLGVVVRSRARCAELLRESDGRVRGVLLDTPEGLRRVEARRGVVLACGGFIHNRLMLEAQAPELAACSVPWASAGDEGDGILLGTAVGGATARMNQGFAIMPLYPPEKVLAGIVVNRHGQRYIAEDAYHAFMGHATAYQQGGQGFLLCDGASDYPRPDYRLSVKARGDSIGQLEQRLALPPEALQLTVRYYNHYARRGRDPLFGKQRRNLRPLEQAPFVAYGLGVGEAFYAVHTFGGLQTTPGGEVLRLSGAPIEGLYAAGRTTWGLPGAPYVASGISLGDCTFFGRLAGRSAAEFPMALGARHARRGALL